MLISVIVPVYNGENFIKDTLLSIQNQTCTDFECLVVDDGSIDNTKQIVNDLHQDAARFSFIPLEHHGAPGHARNEGLRRAKGEYVVYFDSDDYMFPNFLEIMLSKMEENTDLVIGNFRTFDVVNKKVLLSEMDSFIQKKQRTTNDLFTISPFPCNKMYRKKFLLDTNVWYLEGVFNQDLSYFLSLCMHHPSFQVVEEEVMEYHVRPNSITTSKKTAKKHIDILACFDQVFDEYEKEKAYDLEYGLYEMFIKTMIYKISFFDLEKDTKEINQIRDYL